MLASNVVAENPIQINCWSVKERLPLTLKWVALIGLTRTLLAIALLCERKSGGFPYSHGCLMPPWSTVITSSSKNYPDVSSFEFSHEIVLFYLQGSQPIPSRPGPSHNRSEIVTRVTENVSFNEKGHFIVVNNHQRKCENCSA